MKALLIDNYDSFSWNLYDLIGKVIGAPPTVVRNDEEVDLSSFDFVVLSPGPGHPANERDFGICRRVLHEAEIPVLGVCLGHQGLCLEAGGRVAHAPRPCHGEVDDVHHAGDSIFRGLPSPFRVVRYHSLVATHVPEDLNVIARTADGLIMAVRHRERPQWGVQFHPESICSEYGEALIRNFVDVSGAGRQRARTRPEASPPLRILTRRVRSGAAPEAVFAALHMPQRPAVWLDTSLPSEQNRFSLIGSLSGPRAEHLSYSLPDRRLTTRTRNGDEVLVGIDLLDHLSGRLAERRIGSPPDCPFSFNLGYVGYLGYEMKGVTGGSIAHVSPHPDAQFLFLDRALVHDNREDEYWLLALSDACVSDGAQDPETVAWFEATEAAILAAAMIDANGGGGRPPCSAMPVVLRHDRDRYVEKIRRSLRKIVDGESYEVCLTNMAAAPCPDEPLELYRRLRLLSPVPYGAFLDFGALAVLCGSPEQFLSVSESGAVRSKPIKGTRPTSVDPVTDATLVADLRSSEKDRAENLMIVDLVRNDLSRVCEIGSVLVPKIFDVESYTHVHQLVSTITGQLRRDMTAIDCIRSCFPGGSMTGAPKIRTMEIIDELEEGPRGVYSGTIGYLALNGSADLNIVIRTIVLSDATATFGVGGAIIALSDEKAEYEETLLKARPAMAALGCTIRAEEIAQ
jgi:para-aminobenzoate synthetase